VLTHASKNSSQYGEFGEHAFRHFPHMCTPFSLRTFSVPIPFSQNVPCTGHRFWSLHVASRLVLLRSSGELLVVFEFCPFDGLIYYGDVCHPSYRLILIIQSTVSSMSLNFPVHFCSPFLIHLFYSSLISHFCHRQSLLRSFTRDIRNYLYHRS